MLSADEVRLVDGAVLQLHHDLQQDIDRPAFPYSLQGSARQAVAHGPGGDPQHLGGLCDGIPHHPGRSTVLSHRGDLDY
jgi:hypothetical protein